MFSTSEGVTLTNKFSMSEGVTLTNKDFGLTSSRSNPCVKSDVKKGLGMMRHTDD